MTQRYSMNSWLVSLSHVTVTPGIPFLVTSFKGPAVDVAPFRLLSACCCQAPQCLTSGTVSTLASVIPVFQTTGVPGFAGRL